jgi:SHS2 domain-containing protein
MKASSEFEARPTESDLRSDLPPYEELDHPADLRLLARGHDLKKLFVHAAQGMFYLMRCEPGGEGQPVSHQVVLDSHDLEALLVDWLNELLYLSEAEGELYHTYNITHLKPTRLEAVIHGTTNRPPQKGIKATTFSDLRTIRSEAGYEVAITFDV